MVPSIARAYATIGVPRGASAREIKQQYKRLVRTWHPDRWINDPLAHAEAASRMRLINNAYTTLAQLLTREQQRSAPPRRGLTKEELDAIVEAIGTESPLTRWIRTLVWMLPLGTAFLLLLRF